MPNPQRQKGDRFERDCIHQLKELGVQAERVPLSGSAGGSFTGDIRIDLPLTTLEIECKTRARAWKDLFDWLKNDKHPPFALFIKADRTDTLVVLSLEDFTRLLKQEII
jgi:Holliday junction resolvase